ncbi:MAG: ion transporter, partial [Lachnospiraceae bacterium]
FLMLETGYGNDWISRGYDILNTGMIVINLMVSILITFDSVKEHYAGILQCIEFVTVSFFAVDYVLRLYTAKFAHPRLSEVRAIFKYAFSFTGIVDLLSFLLYFLPVFFPTGVVAFRMFRIVRVFRLFRINAYYDSLNVITEVISSKSQQLLSSIFIILVLMIASSLCMYSLEHEAQPDVFQNAFSGIWWSVSTLLTVGYGDIYPITPMGKIFGIFISFLGVGMVAIPTGIISAGFVDQYSKIKRMSEYANEEDIHFIRIHLTAKDKWSNCAIKDLGLPRGVIVAIIQREQHIIVPRGNVVLLPEDIIVLGAESYDCDEHIELKEVILKEQNPWKGQKIRDIDISRRSVIVMIKRNGIILIPHGDLVLQVGDKLVLYTQSHVPNANQIEI